MKPEFNKRAKDALQVSKLAGYDVQVHTVTANSRKSLALLRKAYAGAYSDAFPIDAEREALEVWLKNLKGQNPAVNIVIVIAGDHLDASNPVIKTISVAYYYREYDAGLLAYNAVAPEFQGQGLGRAMVDARKQALLALAQANGKKLGGVFIECNDPAKISPQEDVMDPAVRIAMFKKWGAVALPINYVQPPLAAGAEKCDTLKLLAYPHPQTGKYPAKAKIKDYLKGIYTELSKYTGCLPEKNPDYLNSVRQLEALDLKKFYGMTRTAQKKQRFTP